MSQLTQPVKKSWPPQEPLKTLDTISLQLLNRLGRKHDAAPKAVMPIGGDTGHTVQLKQRRILPASLYSTMRLLKTAQSAWNGQFYGWRGGMAGFTILASIILVFNISALVWTATHLDNGHYATILVGTNDHISNISSWMHLCINILSIALLAGSNYCMQCLSSPARAEIDAAHTRGSYLNIGSISWRNILSTRKRRVCLMLLLSVSSVAMPPLYDTSLLMTTSLYRYTSALVTSDHKVVSYGDFPFRNISIPLSYSGEDRSSRLRHIEVVLANNEIWNSSLWENITATECAGYGYLQTDRSTLLIMFNGTMEEIYAGKDPRFAPYRSPMYSYILQGFLRHDLHPVYSTTEKGWASTSKWPSRISYCLARKVPARAKIQSHLWILLATTIFNAIKLGCLWATLREQQDTPLITAGDAIASFLESPCPRSAGMSLLSSKDIDRAQKIGQDDVEMNKKTTPVKFNPKRLRYYRAVSTGRSIVYIASSMFVIAFAIHKYGQIRDLFRQTNPDFALKSSWRTFGQLDDHSLSDRTLCDYGSSYLDNNKWVHCRMTYAGLSTMILTSLPQLAVAAIYLSLNHQLTLMIQLRDWTSLAWCRQGLRVSDPESDSDQISTWWLSLPYHYSVPLLITSFLMGWLLSQTIFIVRYDLYDDVFEKVVDPGRYSIGFSVVALVCSIVVGLLILGTSVAVGFCKCPPGLPLGPSNSLNIAAACQPPENDPYAARRKVMWGALLTGDGNEVQQRCTITSRRVMYPVEGEWYE
ncbi:hypothetical protein DE146DRAFT_791945 [Phaeosphaeria sp. MPI-PUGE-AT-0046c]|nr:hypothetical protein DE146DRAFT_791945 [Phaeosphaeria sp. MPI-PUGE-AT-0046c]